MDRAWWGSYWRESQDIQDQETPKSAGDFGEINCQLLKRLTVAGLLPHRRHNYKRKRKVSLIYKDCICFPCQNLVETFIFTESPPLVLIPIYAVIKFCELQCIMYIIVSADLWLKKQASKDFVLLLPTGMCISWVQADGTFLGRWRKFTRTHLWHLVLA